MGDLLTKSTVTTVVPTIQLGKGSISVSRTIQGYWELAGGHRKYNADEAVKNMEAHFNAGITTLDTADIYGASEQVMGRFLKNFVSNNQHLFFKKNLVKLIILFYICHEIHSSLPRFLALNSAVIDTWRK